MFRGCSGAVAVHIREVNECLLRCGYLRDAGDRIGVRQPVICLLGTDGGGEEEGQDHVQVRVKVTMDSSTHILSQSNVLDELIFSLLKNTS